MNVRYDRPGEETAIVLAGGLSSRMGRPKALLPFDGEPLIVHVVRTLQPLFGGITVVAAPGQELPDLPAHVVRDDVPHQGPVAGVYYGLRAAGAGASFVVSCDSVFLNAALIRHLVDRLDEHDAVVPCWGDRLQPLHAVYRQTALPVLEQQLARGQLRLRDLFDRVRTLRVGDEEIRRFDPEGLSFFRMNTPGDYALALSRWRTARG